MNLFDVIRRPLTTEKMYAFQGTGRYAFEVHPDANKHEIKLAVEQMFEVSVVKVNVINEPAKRKRMGRRWIIREPIRRKAVVQLKEGQTIRALETAG